ATEDIVIESAVSEELRIEATQEIKEIFHEISNAGLEKKSFLLDKQGKKMGEIVKKLLAEIQQQPKQLSMLADIFVTDQYVFQHSLNVTIYSLALGISLQFPQKKNCWKSVLVLCCTILEKYLSIRKYSIKRAG